MACNVRRNCKTKIMITINKITTGSGYDNNPQMIIEPKYTVSAEVKTSNASETYGGDITNISYTHLFILDYFIEYEEILANTKEYRISYNGDSFDISGGYNEDYQNRRFVIEARLRKKSA